MEGSTAALLVGGLFSLTVAAVSGLLAFYTARANLNGEIQKVREQVDAQRSAQEQAEIATLRQDYLAPLRYYATALSSRFAELEAKLRSAEAERVRGWFKILKDQVARDQLRADFTMWCYYEGLFAATTIYYTCSYFQVANDIRSARPFAVSRAGYSQHLEELLDATADRFVWNDGETGIWRPSQEVIGELFRRDDRKMTYAQMCAEFVADGASRRAPFLRALDFYWSDLGADNTQGVREALDRLVRFLDTSVPLLVAPPGAHDAAG
jgi:hypothetical protein